MDLIVCVTAIKEIKGKTFVVVDGSFHNLGEICELKKLPLRVVRKSSQGKSCKQADIVGNTCLEQDVLYHDFSGDISVGDYLIFGNVGGYSNVCKPPFIHPNCAIIEIGENKIRLIKNAETTEDIMRSYVFAKE